DAGAAPAPAGARVHVRQPRRGHGRPGLRDDRRLCRALRSLMAPSLAPGAGEAVAAGRRTGSAGLGARALQCGALTGMPESVPPFTLLRSRAAWRRWLERHHRTRTEVWLAFYRQHTGKVSVSSVDAVEEALCFGWIDGKARRVDEE